MKLNYIMTRVKTLLAYIIYFNNHYKQKTKQVWGIIMVLTNEFVYNIKRATHTRVKILFKF